jgi:hypothetical protein
MHHAALALDQRFPRREVPGLALLWAIAAETGPSLDPTCEALGTVSAEARAKLDECVSRISRAIQASY